MNRCHEELPLPGLSVREAMEKLGAEGLVDYIIRLGEIVTKKERDMNLASSVLEETFGLTVEDVPQQRELKTVSQKDILFDAGEKQNGARK
jgi:hypothetical protein